MGTRITPRQLSYGGYTISRNRLSLALGLTAGTETPTDVGRLSRSASRSPT